MIENRDYKADILVVDDTPDNLRVLSAILAKQGYMVRKALNGQLALMACQKTLPDIILLDITMPEMNGYEVCQQLKASQRTREIPVIFISALDDSVDKVKAFNVGGVDYITKPFQGAEVISRLENHLKLRSLQLALQEKNVSLQREIEERKKTQEALEASEAKNLALLNAIPDVMLRINTDGTLIDYRAAQQIVTGETSAATAASAIPNFPSFGESFIGKQISEMLSQDLTIWVSHYVEQALFESAIQVGEYVQQVNGIWHAYEARFLPSGLDEVLAIVRDISDRKKLEADRLEAQVLLMAQKQQLEAALQDLKQAQTQLVQNEKMVSLGQLVAGIAHEINNPVNFIYGNIAYANTYFQELVRLIETYQEECQPSAKMHQILQETDLDFLMKDLEKLLGSMSVGAERIRQIVLSLRNFARLDEASTKFVNIHEGIDNTLLLLQHRLKKIDDRFAIEVIKEYGNLPKVTCYASQLNQVFFHLLNNAIDALELGEQAVDKGDGKGEIYTNPHPDNPTIWIHTEQTAADTVLIRIKDNGPGISESVRSRLFDPFFTTKPVGSGRGLGLSISYQIIVQLHQGTIACFSQPGQGAEFVIEIPYLRCPAVLPIGGTI